MQLNMGKSGSIKEHELIDLRRQFNDLRQEESLAKNKVLRKEKEKKMFKPGDEVITETYGQRGTLVEKKGNSEWVVQMGIMKMKLPESDLRLIKEEPQQQKRQRQIATVKSSSSSHVATQLDLSGQRLKLCCLRGHCNCSFELSFNVRRVGNCSGCRRNRCRIDRRGHRRGHRRGD